MRCGHVGKEGDPPFAEDATEHETAAQIGTPVIQILEERKWKVEVECALSHALRSPTANKVYRSAGEHEHIRSTEASGMA
jgi:endonuclease V-like protein UPF0215 family